MMYQDKPMAKSLSEKMPSMPAKPGMPKPPMPGQRSMMAEPKKAMQFGAMKRMMGRK